ncbi:hypothetical protein C0J52_23943 [Blattella germanica]|nr:hypothetical protein C0J52_23943 [Blattella germanica]
MLHSCGNSVNSVSLIMIIYLVENYRDSLRIISRNADIDSFNYAELRKNNNPVAIIKAIHNNRTASEATADEAMGLQKTFRLSVGAKIILRQNLWTSKGLCNFG